ncbi:PREDICTED: growth hormone secretagogue receptor type 1-like, partial [Cyprinodon variegatus]|uniref:growth hormone secretagogue receptor type 1-like n=1 Tax=Cyprinodon variegatus TaxID=28743 RepID=UPI00074282AA
CVTVIYIPLMLFGLLGNILTILVVWLRPHMRSSTYLYLSSMAVSDLLILLLLPLDLYKCRPRHLVLHLDPRKKSGDPGVIVLAFVLCWLPFHVGRTILTLSLGSDANIYFLYYLSQYFTLVSSVLFYLSAAVNPLLYNLMSARYRLAVH